MVIVGQNLTIINAGTISGSTAIVFTGGTNSSTPLAASSMTGNVGGGGTNTLVLGGTTDSSFDLSKLGSQYQNFAQFQKTGSSIWDLSNTDAGATTGWESAMSGTLNLAGSNATATTVNNSGTIGIDGTSTLTATGGITNNLGDIITVAQGGTVNDDLDNAGTVSNNGAAYNATINSNTGSITNTATGVWTGDITSNASNSTGITNDGSWIGNVIANTGTINNNLTWTGTISMRHFQQQRQRHSLRPVRPIRRGPRPTTASSTAAPPSAAAP